MQQLITINCKAKIELRIARLSKVDFDITQTYEITKNKVVSSVLHEIISWQISAPRKKKYYISIPKISIYLSIFIFFADSASLKYKCR